MTADSTPMAVPAPILEAMIAHARFESPLEACGLLAADEAGGLRMCYCLSNADRSATRFTVEPTEHFRAMQHAEANGWHLAGAFHSHTRTEAVPSATDVALAYEPGWIHVIVGLRKPREPEVRAFSIVGGAAREIDLDVIAS